MNTLKLMFLLFIVTHLSLEASYFELAQKAYYEKNYKKAIYYFKKSKKEYLNIEMQLLWADSEKELGNSGYIISAYERILNLEPKNFKVSYKLIEIYKDLNLKQEIRKVILNFDDSDYLPNKRSQLAQDLKIINLETTKLSTHFLHEIGYDSDIDKISYRDNIKKKINLPSNTKTSSMFSKSIVSASYIQNKGNWFVEIDIDAMKKLNWIEPFYDLGYVKANSALGYNTTNIIVSFPLHYSNTYFIEKDIIKNYGINPSISTIIGSDKKIELSLKLEETRHSQNEMKLYDFNTYGISSGMHVFYNENYFSTNVSYTKIFSTNKYNTLLLPRYVDSEIYGLSMDAMFHLNNGYMINVDYELRLMNSSVENYLDEGTLKDNFNSIGFVLSKNLSKRMKIFAKANYYTNLTIFYSSDYDKITSSIGLEYNF